MKKPIRFGLVPLALAWAVAARADDAAAAPKPDELATLRADNKQLSDELAASWKETATLKADLAAAQAASARSGDSAADLQKQLDAAKAQAAAPAPADTGAATQVSDLQDKLDTALHSFTVLQDENTKLKDSLDKEESQNANLNQQLDAAHASIAALQAQTASASQIDPLRAQVRQAEDESSQLAAENAQLRTRLALLTQNPGSSAPVPQRPSSALPPAPAPQGASPAAAGAAPVSTPKTYTVAEGDTLTRISRKFYGTSSRWRDILNANRGVLKDEKSLVIGSTLRIP